jgi:hypothetical protein
MVEMGERTHHASCIMEDKITYDEFLNVHTQRLDRPPKLANTWKQFEPSIASKKLQSCVYYSTYYVLVLPTEPL